MENISSGNQRKRKNIILITVVAVVIIALIAVIIYLLNRNLEAAMPPPVLDRDIGARGTVVTEDNLQEILERRNQPLEDAYYEVNMSVEWDFDTALTPSRNAFVRNKETNTRTVFFDVFMEDRNEVVYSSPYIPLGAELKNFALDTKVEAGVHPALVTYYLVDDDYNTITNVSVYVTLNIAA